MKKACRAPLIKRGKTEEEQKKKSGAKACDGNTAADLSHGILDNVDQCRLKSDSLTIGPLNNILAEPRHQGSICLAAKNATTIVFQTSLSWNREVKTQSKADEKTRHLGEKTASRHLLLVS